MISIYLKVVLVCYRAEKKMLNRKRVHEIEREGERERERDRKREREAERERERERVTISDTTSTIHYAT